MTKKIWKSEAVSIIVLPSGQQGEQLMELAQAWSRSWLLSPALWMLADETPLIDQSRDIDLQTPPSLYAYLLGRDLEQNPVKEKVDVFWTLGSQPFKKIRFIAVRMEQESSAMERTSLGAEAAAKFIERAIPKVTDLSKEDLSGALFSKYNLVIAPTNERNVLQGVLSQFWDANLVAAAEDRATPLSTDSFVKVGERFTGFALAHIATTAGLWAGLPVSSAEIRSEKTQLRQARLQRVFVRGVTNDALSADVAHWALQKLNYSDTNFEVGLVDGNNVATIAGEYEEIYMNNLVDYILRGPNTDSGENFLYKNFEESIFTLPRISWFKKLVTRIQDMAEGLGAIPKWFGASADYRLQMAIDDLRDENILYEAVPKRLAPRVKLPPVDVLLAQLRPKLPMPKPDLWRHIRESMSAAIDAPTSNHPQVLTDNKDGKFLVFATVDRVLPNPETRWSGDRYKSGTKVNLTEVNWLDASAAHHIDSEVNKRLEELAPGIEDARNQLSETQKMVNEAEQQWKVVTEDLSLIERELKEDVEIAEQARVKHSHNLPKSVTGPRRKPGEKPRRIDSKHISATGSEKLNQEVESGELIDVNGGKKPSRFSFGRFFSRKSRSKS